MTFPARTLLAVIAALGLTLLLSPGVRAQNADSIRVVRLSRAEGQVLVSHPGSDAWEEAPVNLPLLEGDTLTTQDGLAEIEFENGATAYLAENSVLQFSQLGFSSAGRVTELTLTQGAGTFYANLTSQDSFRVHAPTFDVAIPERAEFRVDAFRDGAAAEVFTGNVSVSTSKGSTDLVKGQSVAVHEKDFQDFSIGTLPSAEDAFDQWVTQQGEIIRSGNKNTVSYINTPNSYGLADLSIYGTWVNFPGYGYSWRPFSVGLNWTPYFNGVWQLDPRLGWIWVSSEPWGWQPYHFGAWLLSPTLGWVWVPGSSDGLQHWQGSRVNWVHTGNQVGWVPKSPDDREGIAANAAHGVMTQPLRSSKIGAAQNEIVTGKDLRNVTPVKQPPADFASRPAPGIPSTGVRSTLRATPRTLENNESIVLDHQTHTFINRDGRNGNEATRNDPPVPPAAFMPRPESGANRRSREGFAGKDALAPQAQTEVPRVILPPANPGKTINRVLLPPPYPTVPGSRANVPPTTNFPPRTPSGVPLNNQLHPVVAPPPVQAPAMPRPVAPPPVAQPNAIPRYMAPPTQPSQPAQPGAPPAHMQTPATPPSAQVPVPAQPLGSVARPGPPDSRAVSHPNSQDHR